MNVSSAVREYVLRMISDVSGMKVMLFDKETSGIVSMVLSQSDILERDVFLTEMLSSNKREKMTHLKAIIFVRPTPANIRSIKQELRDPHYGEYHLFFSNIIKPAAIEELAHGDENEIVRQVQEFFGDFFAIHDSLFSLNLPPLAPHQVRDTTVAESDFRLNTQRVTEGLAAVLLALKKRPSIRFQANSSVCEHVAKLIWQRMEEERELFHQVRRGDAVPLLLIIDRREDPVTPLLTQWTYQAMVHELLGIHNHRVSLKNAPNVRKDQKEIVMATHQDEFFKENVNTNFGDLGINVKELVDSYQKKHKSHQNIESIADMQRFVENYPEFRKLSGNVSKHVTVMSELSRVIESNKLMEVSQVEQQLACSDNHSEVARQLHSLVSDQQVKSSNKLRLLVLYALRYEERGNTELQSLIDEFRSHGADAGQIRVISDVVSYAGARQRCGDLFSTKNIFNSLRKTVQRELVGVANVYTQHKPLLDSLLTDLSKNRLKEQLYPFLDNASRERPQEVIVFMVGGTTFEESLFVDEFNRSNVGVRVVLGGTHVHNSASFLNGIKSALGMADM